MVAVALIVTGEMEKRGLAPALQRAFPEAEFLEPQKVDCFTSAKVLWPPPSARGVKSNVEKYAAALVAALDPGRRRDRKPDFVFAVEDLELVNRLQPENVVQALCLAVAAELESRRPSMNAAAYEKLAERVKEKCSFHLFAPMPEAYFFADDGALKAAGCTRTPQLRPGADVECFETTDPEYSAQTVRAFDPAHHPFHPKCYLEFLAAPAEYRETKQGSAALSVLDWKRVLAVPEQTLFLRSLFHDLADAVSLEPSALQGAAHSLTSNYKDPNRILRNC